mgnify:CR=1 FL=1
MNLILDMNLLNEMFDLYEAVNNKMQSAKLNLNILLN